MESAHDAQPDPPPGQRVRACAGRRPSPPTPTCCAAASNVGAFGWNQVAALAAGAGGEDRWGYRAEFLDLVDRARA